MSHPEAKTVVSSSSNMDGMVRRLASVIYYYRGRGGSTHERTKEVWGALQALLNMSEESWDEWTPLIADRYTPTDMGPNDAKYFKENLLALLRAYTREARGASPRMKRELAKIIRDALDASVQAPFPEVCEYVKSYHPDALERDRFKECKEVNVK